jgi:hypothetical protein
MASRGDSREDSLEALNGQREHAPKPLQEHRVLVAAGQYPQRACDNEIHIYVAAGAGDHERI